MTLEQDVKKAVVTYLVKPMSMTASSAYFDGGTIIDQYDNGGFDEIIVKCGPVLELSAVVNVFASTSGSALTSTAYNYDEDYVWLRSGECFSEGRKKWRLDYLAGYASMPEDIQRAITIWVDALTTDAVGNLASYTTGDDSETYFDLSESVQGMPATVKILLSKYKKRFI